MIQQKKHTSVVTQLFGQPYIKNGIKKKRSLLFLLAFALILIPSISALTITDTTFSTSDSNYTILVDSITLDQVIVENDSIQFHNLTSIASNFTNTNATFDSIATFVGLKVGLTVKNINTSAELNSTLGNQDFNVTFTAGQILQIVVTTPTTGVCGPAGLRVGFNSFFDSIGVVFSILVVIIIILLIWGVIIVIQDPSKLTSLDIDFSKLDLPKIFIGILIVSIIALISTALIAIMCAL